MNPARIRTSLDRINALNRINELAAEVKRLQALLAEVRSCTTCQEKR